MPNEEKKVPHRVSAIDSGAALKKGVSQLREGQNQAKPAGLVRPKGVVVPPVKSAQSTTSTDKK
jgi:hypothetical protein